MHEPESRPISAGEIYDTDVPLTVWACAQERARHQGAGRYPRENVTHPARTLPELARQAITAFSKSGDLVVDPMCGTGTTCIEAARLGRTAIGVELDDRWARLAEENLAQVCTGAERRRARIVTGDARRLTTLLPDLDVGEAGAVDLVVTSPPQMRETQRNTLAGRWAGGPSARHDGDIGGMREQTYVRAMAEVYAQPARLLRPGGLLVVITKNTRAGDRLVNLAGTTVELAQAAGLRYVQHIVALHAAVRQSTLIAWPSRFSLFDRRQARAGAPITHLSVHEDVFVFAKPRTRRPEGARR